MRRNLTGVASILSIVLFAAGCTKIKEFVNTPDPDHTAKVAIAYKGEDVEALVVASGNKDSLEGVGYLRSEEWGKAAEAFGRAIGANEKDFKSHFGLAVSYEKMGQSSKALAEYKRASELHYDPMYGAGMHRTQEAGK